MKCDCDLTGHVESIEDLAPRERDDATLVELYERYGFRTWLRDLTGDAERVPAGDARVAAAPPVAPAEQDYRIIADWDAFDAWMAKVAEAPLVALDTETTSLDEMQARLVGLSMAVAPGVACYIPVAHRGLTARNNCPRTRCWRGSSPGLKTPRGPSCCTTPSTTPMCSRTKASSWPASPRTPCCRPMCWNRTVAWA